MNTIIGLLASRFVKEIPEDIVMVIAFCVSNFFLLMFKESKLSLVKEK